MNAARHYAPRVFSVLLVIAVVLAFYSSLARSQAETDAPFLITLVAFEDEGLTLGVTPQIERAEIVAEPKLVGPDSEMTAKVLATTDGQTLLVFEGATAATMDAIASELVFPAVSVPIEVHRKSPIGGEIAGPADIGFTIVEWEVDEDSQTVNMRYVPTKPSSLSIVLARIESGDSVVEAIAVSTSHEPATLNLAEGLVTFPISVLDVLDDDEAILVISEYREMVQVVQDLEVIT